MITTTQGEEEEDDNEKRREKIAIITITITITIIKMNKKKIEESNGKIVLLAFCLLAPTMTAVAVKATFVVRNMLFICLFGCVSCVCVFVLFLHFRQFDSAFSAQYTHQTEHS